MAFALLPHFSSLLLFPWPGCPSIDYFSILPVLFFLSFSFGFPPGMNDSSSQEQMSLFFVLFCVGRKGLLSRFLFFILCLFALGKIFLKPRLGRYVGR